MTTDTQLRAVKQIMEEAIPFNAFLGIKVHEIEEGRIVLRLPFSESLVGDVYRPAIHGGVISTLIDTAGGGAVFTRFQHFSDRASTVDLRVDYLRPVPTNTTIFCEGRVLRMGNKVAVTQMNVYADQMPVETDAQERLTLAMGKGVYNVLRKTEGV